MKKVLFRAPVLSESGYGVHARQILRYLKKKEEEGKISLQCQVLPWGNTTWKVDPAADGGLIGYAMSRTCVLSPPYDVTFQLQLPNEWDPKLGLANIGLTAGVETDVANPSWVSACNCMTRVVVPSLHVKSVFEETAKRNFLSASNLFVVPESYIPAVLGEGSQIDLGLDSSDFAVLLNGQITGMNSQLDRKNMFNAIKWLCETFKEDKQFAIVVKTNMARNTVIDRMVTTNVMSRLLSEVRSRKSPKLVLVHGDLTDEEVTGLYKNPNIKALVSLTRGEGFGLPLLEAAVAGLPVVATNWSAHTEFLGDDFVKVSNRLIEIPQQKVDNKIFVKGSKWADPDELEFKTKMKAFRSDQTKALESAKRLSSTLRNTHSLEAVFSLYDSVVGDVL